MYFQFNSILKSDHLDKIHKFITEIRASLVYYLCHKSQCNLLFLL